MLWRFTILDRNNVAIVVDEPTGWDANTSEIKRDLDWHGILFTNQGETFLFDGKAKKLLKDEYDQYGVQGDMTLVMEEDCGNGYEEFSRAKFMFKDYEFVCGDECYVKVPVETTKETRDLRNRLNQKVNLETTKAFDEVTTLPTYNKLPFEMELPSKGIVLKNHFEQTVNFTTPVLGVPDSQQGGPNTFNSQFGIVEFGFDKQKAVEIGNSGTELQARYNCVSTFLGNLGCNSLNRFQFTFPLAPGIVAPLDISAITNYQEGTPNYGQVSDVIDFNIDIQGSIESINCQFQNFYFVVATLPKGRTGLNDADFIYHKRQLINPTGILQPVGSTIGLNLTYTNSSFILDKGDMVFVYLAVYHRRENQYSGTNGFNMSFNTGSYIKMETLSKTPATTSKVFAVNEVISRVAETITNDKLRAYSEYFGRTDSQPYIHDVDGCGSLEVISDGIRVRKQENRIPNKPSLFSMSLQDIFEGLNPIHNIGMGVEADPNRIGYNRLRVEPWRYFYNNTIILSCTNVAKINRRVFEKEIFSTFQFGYQKWEAEEYTGLDEFLTKRTYRTTLNQVKNDLVKLSKFIASGYALEITRRKGDNNSKDWRYDKDAFIICVKRNNTGDLVVELGNIVNPQNIIDPTTLYNYRISPVRNALRWVNKLFESYKQFDSNAKLIFTDGDANYYAQGEMQNTDCALESGLITENERIDLTLFADTLNAKPFLIPERVVYEYPMSSKDYKLIEANPYGLIYFSSDCEDGNGWIDSIQYKPEEGKATFNLIPKAN